MIQYLFLDTSKLLNISDITKRIGNFFKLPIQLFMVFLTHPPFLSPTYSRGGGYASTNQEGLWLSLTPRC